MEYTVLHKCIKYVITWTHKSGTVSIYLHNVLCLVDVQNM